MQALSPVHLSTKRTRHIAISSLPSSRHRHIDIEEKAQAKIEGRVPADIEGINHSTTHDSGMSSRLVAAVTDSLNSESLKTFFKPTRRSKIEILSSPSVVPQNTQSPASIHAEPEPEALSRALANQRTPQLRHRGLSAGLFSSSGGTGALSGPAIHMKHSPYGCEVSIVDVPAAESRRGGGEGTLQVRPP